MLAHTAEAMGIVTAETIADHDTIEIDFDMIPRATYCQPQIASFGYSEAQAKEKGYDVKVAKFPFSANGKAKGLGDTSGFVKLVADAKYNEIIGAHLIGPDVTELLPALTLAQKWDLTADEVARNVFAHPTLSEAVKEASRGPRGPHDPHVGADSAGQYPVKPTGIHGLLHACAHQSKSAAVIGRAPRQLRPSSGSRARSPFSVHDLAPASCADRSGDQVSGVRRCTSAARCPL